MKQKKAYLLTLVRAYLLAPSDSYDADVLEKLINDEARKRKLSENFVSELHNRVSAELRREGLFS